jgi:hypothetical protein
MGVWIIWSVILCGAMIFRDSCEKWIPPLRCGMTSKGRDSELALRMTSKKVEAGVGEDAGRCGRGKGLAGLVGQRPRRGRGVARHTDAWGFLLALISPSSRPERAARSGGTPASRL